MRRVGARFLIIAASVLLPTASLAQSIAGTLVAADTGDPVTSATVVAIATGGSSAVRPAVYKAIVDSAGNYSMTVPAGQYRLCVYGAEPFLNPCQWSNGPATNVVSAAAASTAPNSPLTLQKGVQLIVRVHDPNGVLAQAESVPGGAVSAYLSGSGVAQFPLPVVSSGQGFRDYGTYIPFNSPLIVFVSGHSLALQDKAGAVLNPQGISIQVLPADLQLPQPPPPSLGAMFTRPTAKVVHVYAAALQ